LSSCYSGAVQQYGGHIMALFKAIALGAFLTWFVTLFIGSAGSSGGHLYIRHVIISGHTIYWSWPLFIASTGLSGGIFWMMK
jgi:hypothetical protein